MNDLQYFLDTLGFTKQYNVTFSIVFEDGQFFIQASLDRVTAQHTFDPADPQSIAGAVWDTLGSVRAGVEFHTVHGYVPGLDLAKNYPRVRGSDGSRPSRDILDNAPRDLRPKVAARRDGMGVRMGE